jgi:hypothetical protein
MGDAVRLVDRDDPTRAPGVRRPHRRGLQAREWHLGERRPLRARWWPRSRRSRRTSSSAANEEYVAALILLGGGLPGDAGPTPRRARRLAAHPRLLELLRADSRRTPVRTRGSASEHAAVLPTPPSLDAGEITDKARSTSARAARPCRAGPRAVRRRAAGTRDPRALSCAATASRRTPRAAAARRRTTAVR